MRVFFTLLLAGLLATPSWAAEPPALTFQTKPVGEMFEDIRAGAKMIGGEPLIQQFNEFLKQQDTEQFLKALDLKRSIAGYVFLTGKETESKSPPLMLVIPVGDKEAMLEGLSKAENKWTEIDKEKDLYKRTNTDDDSKFDYLRYQNGLAYYLIGGEAKMIAPDQLVPLDKLVLPQEKAWLTVRFNFARMPEELRTQANTAIEEALKELKNAPIPADAEESVRKIEEMAKKLSTRLLSQAKEANEAVFRVQFERGTGELSMELGLSGLPGSSLAKSIASRGVTKNRFATMMGKDTVVGILGAAPVLSKDIGEMVAISLEEAAKTQAEEVPPPMQALVQELSQGLARSFRQGEMDWGLCLNGPSAKGTYSAVVGLSFDDPSKLEKEVKTLVQELAPPEFAQLIKLDAAKIGRSTIHLITPPEGVLPPQANDLFGEEFRVGLAFTPKSILIAVSADPIATLKPLLTAEPAPARALDIMLNPGRVAKLATLVSPDGGDFVAELLGNKDERVSAFFTDLEGGAELKLKMGMNIKIIGKAIYQAINAFGGIEP